jgi:hypothetical protein
LQINQSRAQSRLHGILSLHAVEDMRLFKSMFEDQWKLRGPENFTNWVIKISGRNGTDMEGIYDSMDGLWEDYDLIPSTSFVRDRMSMTQAVEKGVTIFGPQMFNMQKTAAAYLELNGLPDASTVLLSGYEPISPDDKHAQLAQGNWIQPSPAMPLPELMLHLASDIAMMNSVIKHTSGFNPKEENILFLQLEKLIPIEQQMQNNMLAILAQMGEAGGGIPGMMGVTGAGGTPAGAAGSVGMPAVQGGLMGGMAPQDRGGGGGGGRPSTVAPDSPVRQAQ